MLFSEKNNTINKSRSGKKTLEKTEGQSRMNNPETREINVRENRRATKNGHSRDTGNIGHKTAQHNTENEKD